MSTPQQTHKRSLSGISNISLESLNSTMTEVSDKPSDDGNKRNSAEVKEGEVSKVTTLNFSVRNELPFAGRWVFPLIWIFISRVSQEEIYFQKWYFPEKIFSRIFFFWEMIFSGKRSFSGKRYFPGKDVSLGKIFSWEKYFLEKIFS